MWVGAGRGRRRGAGAAVGAGESRQGQARASASARETRNESGRGHGPGRGLGPERGSCRVCGPKDGLVAKRFDPETRRPAEEPNGVCKTPGCMPVLRLLVLVLVLVAQLLLPRTERRRPWSSRCIASAAASTAASLSSMAPRDSSSARSLAWC